MAGGSGTRFWPASRAAKPKQFLTIGGEHTLVRQTALRVADAVGWDKILVVTARVHAEQVGVSLPEVPENNVLVEPTGRNTAPCIGWATNTIHARDPDARVAVLAADHFVSDTEGFRTHLEAAFDAASDQIVTFGIVPTRPETGYGYIEIGAVTSKDGSTHEVKCFVEKPDHETAIKYLQSKRYLWNSGMFVFPASVMKEEIQKHLPKLAEGLAKVADDPDALDRVYPTLPSISIDYGVMEKTERILVMPASFGWSDVGSWDAAKDIYPADASANVTLGDTLLIDVERSMVDARTGRLVAVVGLEDVIVVDTDDAVLVIRRGQSQKVKQIVDKLASKNKKGLL